MFGKLNINHFRAALVAAFPDFDLDQLASDPESLKKHASEQRGTADQSAIDSAVSAALAKQQENILTSLDIDLLEGESLEDALQAHVEEHSAAAEAATTFATRLTESLAASGIAVTESTTGEELTELLTTRIATEAASLLAGSGHNGIVPETPTGKPGATTPTEDSPSADDRDPIAIRAEAIRII